MYMHHGISGKSIKHWDEYIACVRPRKRKTKAAIIWREERKRTEKRRKTKKGEAVTPMSLIF